MRFDGATAEERREIEVPGGQMSDWCYASLNDVQTNVQSTSYPDNKVFDVVGPVEETIPSTLPGPIAVLRLDTDWYESTRHQLDTFFPLLSPNVILLIDDYGTWRARGELSTSTWLAP